MTLKIGPQGPNEEQGFVAQFAHHIVPLNSLSYFHKILHITYI